MSYGKTSKTFRNGAIEGAVVTAAIYMRVSTREQAEKGWSIEGQYKDLRAYCSNLENTKVVRVYKDEGYTGTNLDRPSFQRMLEHASKGYFRKIFCWRFDRFSRNKLEFPTLLDYFQKLNIEVLSVCEPSLDYSTPDGEFMTDLFGLISARERKVILQRSKMGQRIRAEKGLFRGGMPPFGYDYDKNSGKLRINKQEEKIVVTIFQKYLELQSITAVRNYLNQKAIRGKKGIPWSTTVLARLLANNVYNGYNIYNDLKVFDKAIQIIPNDIFEETQRLRQENRVKMPKHFNGSVKGVLDKSDEKILKDIRAMDYLKQKREMPHCPRCGNQFTVIKYGWCDTRQGRLQTFYCRECNYEFRVYPKSPKKSELDKERPKCPDCGSKVIISDGKGFNRKGKFYRKWRCKDCRRGFRIYSSK